MFGKLSEDFSVEFDVRVFERSDEFAIRYVVFAGGRVNFDVPEFTKIALLFSAVMKRVDARMEQRFARGTLFCFALPTKPLCLAKDFPAAF